MEELTLKTHRLVAAVSFQRAVEVITFRFYYCASPLIESPSELVRSLPMPGLLLKSTHSPIREAHRLCSLFLTTIHCAGVQVRVLQAVCLYIALLLWCAQCVVFLTAFRICRQRRSTKATVAVISLYIRP